MAMNKPQGETLAVAARLPMQGDVLAPRQIPRMPDG
jgi:hypothetical protein